MSVKLQEIANALGEEVLSIHGNVELPIEWATSDSRLVRPGTLFCAYKGENCDGADFIPQALKSGAVAVVWEKDEILPVPAIRVKDALRAQGVIAECVLGYPAAKMELAGVTGTNGKTTTTWLLREMFQEANSPCGLIGTVKYDVGGGVTIPGDRTTPTAFALQDLFAQSVSHGLPNLVMEVSSHALEQRRMGTTQCKVAVFTNLTEDHLDYHKTMDAYYEAKKLLFTRHLRQGGVAVLNGDDPWCRKLAEELPSDRKRLVFTLENRAGADVRVENLRMGADGSVFELVFPEGERWELRTLLPGEYNVRNAVCAALAGNAMGLPQKTIGTALARCQGAPGRMQRVDLPGASFSVFVDYAHTDDALRNVLRMLRSLCKGRLFVMFGCGGNRDRKKRPLMARAAEEFADVILVTTDNPRREEPEAIIQEIVAGFSANAHYECICDRREAIGRALRSAGAGDVILIAGKGHEDYQEICGVKHHFSDLETAEELWKLSTRMGTGSLL